MIGFYNFEEKIQMSLSCAVFHSCSLGPGKAKVGTAVIHAQPRKTLSQNTRKENGREISF